MKKNYEKFLGTKLFLIEQVAMRSICLDNIKELKRSIKEILNISADSFEGIKQRMQSSCNKEGEK